MGQGFLLQCRTYVTAWILILLGLQQLCSSQWTLLSNVSEPLKLFSVYSSQGVSSFLIIWGLSGLFWQFLTPESEHCTWQNAPMSLGHTDVPWLSQNAFLISSQQWNVFGSKLHCFKRHKKTLKLVIQKFFPKCSSTHWSAHLIDLWSLGFPCASLNEGGQVSHWNTVSWSYLRNWSSLNVSS